MTDMLIPGGGIDRESSATQTLGLEDALEPLNALGERVSPSATGCLTCGGPKSERAVRCAHCARRGRRGSTLVDPAEPSAEQRRAERQAAVVRFRLYCFSCGRSAPVISPPVRPERCSSCGGTMLTELDPA